MITMFQADIAFLFGLIALTAGVALTVWMRMHTEHTSKFCRGLAYLIILLAILALVCTGYYTTKYWLEGYFSPQMVGQHYQMKRCMMKKCMKMQHMSMMKNRDIKKMPMMNVQKQNLKKANFGCVGDQCQIQKRPMPQMKPMQKRMMRSKAMMDQKNMPNTQKMPISEVEPETLHK